MIKETKLLLAAEDFFSQMKERLEEKEAANYKGWDQDYPLSDLFRDLQNDLTTVGYGAPDTKKLYIDIANRAMMLWYRYGNNSQVIESNKTK